MVWTKPSIALLIAVCFAACGCGMVYGPVEEVDAFISAKSALTDKWLEIAKTNKTSAGIEEARKLFNENKADLIAKKEAIINAPRGINPEWQPLLSIAEGRERDALNAIQYEFGFFRDGTNTELSQTLREEFKALRKEYETAIER